METGADRRRIEAYLEGTEDAAREVDAWIRRELEICYPVLIREMDDIAQLVHSKLLQNLHEGRFQYRSTLKTYVGRIVHYTAIDHIRRKYRERAVVVDWLAEMASTDEDPYSSLEALDEGTLMDEVLLRSPSKCRDLWRMVFLERLSYAEIGRRLSIPVGTIKSRMWECRRKALALRERLRRVGRNRRG